MYKNLIYPIYYNIAMKGNYAILKTLDYKELVSPDYAPKIGLFWFPLYIILLSSQITNKINEKDKSSLFHWYPVPKYILYLLSLYYFDS